MTKILPMQDHSPTGWATGKTVCLACESVGAAVIPAGHVHFMECEVCGCMKKVFRYPLSKGDVTWECDCGNRLFEIVPQGIHCPMCGRMIDV
jgi:rubredoxin